MSTMTPLMAPSVPAKNPGRLARIVTSDTSSSESLPSEQLDIWEHATALYHSYEWQSAAESFLYLSRAIDRDFESSLCLLNAALIFARMGDYTTASHVLDEANTADETLALTTFIVGHVEFELGNLEKAEDSLRVSLGAVRAPVQRFDRYGLNYELRASYIEQCLRIFENGLQHIVGSLGAIPADGVFESPERLSSASAPSSINRRGSVDSGLLPTLTESSLPSSPAMSPIEHSRPFEYELEHDPPALSGLATIKSLEYTNDDVQWHVPEQPKQPTQTPFLEPARPTRVPGMVRNLSTRRNFPAETLGRGASRAKQPRDARLQDHTVTGLAKFVRETRPKNSMEAREAEGSAASTGQLATFFQESEPERRAGLLRSPVYQSTSYEDMRPKSIATTDFAATPQPQRRPSLLSRHRYSSGVGSIFRTESKNDTGRTSSFLSDAPSTNSREPAFRPEQSRLAQRPTPFFTRERNASRNSLPVQSKTVLHKKPELQSERPRQPVEEIGYAQYFGSFGKRFMT